MMNNIGIIRRRVMQMANALVKKGYCRRLAMLKAWIIIKAEKLSVRVAGVTFKQRQQMLAALDGRQALFIKLRFAALGLFSGRTLQYSGLTYDRMIIERMLHLLIISLSEQTFSVQQVRSVKTFL